MSIEPKTGLYLPDKNDIDYEKISGEINSASAAGIMRVGAEVGNRVFENFKDDIEDLENADLALQDKLIEGTTATGFKQILNTGNSQIKSIASSDDSIDLIDNGSWIDIKAGSVDGTLLDLTDTPSSYTGQAGKSLTVAAGETTTEFVSHLPLAGGTMAGDIDMGENNINSQKYLYDGIEMMKLSKAGGSSYNSVSVGVEAGENNNGSAQSVIGSYAGKNNDGEMQIAFGFLAGADNDGAYQNAIGYLAGKTNKGLNQTAIGYMAGYNNTGAHQNAIGTNAGNGNTGDNCIFIGYQSGYQNTLDNQFILKNNNVNTDPLIQGNFLTGAVDFYGNLDLNGNDLDLDGGDVLQGGNASFTDLTIAGTSTGNIFDVNNSGTGGAIQIKASSNYGSLKSIITHRTDNNSLVINENGVDFDFRIEGVGNSNLFKTDAGTNTVSVGGNLTVTSSISTGGDINLNGNDLDLDGGDIVNSGIVNVGNYGKLTSGAEFKIENTSGGNFLTMRDEGNTQMRANGLMTIDTINNGNINLNPSGNLQINGVNGFTGTGTYTTFTIRDGIITSAS